MQRHEDKNMEDGINCRLQAAPKENVLIVHMDTGSLRKAGRGMSQASFCLSAVIDSR